MYKRQGTVVSTLFNNFFVILVCVMAMVASVGPYKLCSLLLGAATIQFSANSELNGSPQKRLNRSVEKELAFNSLALCISAIVEGVENQNVRECFFIKRPGACLSLSGIQNSDAPVDHATNMSCNDRSNVWSNI